ncbi:hypothetical protein BDL97_13G120100 [Sphagnum fallax]|nr:hypothetical protein BDL97_13G120100 [Sphagnum fallax]
MANFSGLFLLVQPRIELNCINFCSANASQFSSKGASASRAHLHRNKWEVMSSLSGSNLMTISKRLGNREDETFDSCMLSPDTSRQNSRADVLRRVVADRGFDRRRYWNSKGQSGVLSGRKWYPMYLTAEVPSNSPLGLTAFDRSLVLFYDGDGKIHCFEDRCPHRSAKLSDGQITNGNLECLYHGWQFNGTGTCVRIPQLAPGAKKYQRLHPPDHMKCKNRRQ